MPRNAARKEQLAQNIDDIRRVELAPNADSKALVRELVDHVEHAIFPSLMRAILDEIVGPNVITALRAQPNARAICEPQTPAFRLFVGNLQSLAPPDPLDPRVVHQPPGMAK